MLSAATSIGGILLAANLALLGPIPSELVERIRGQVSDLRWELVIIDTSHANIKNPWANLKTHTASVTFDMAVWVETSSTHADSLSIFEPETGQLSVKSLSRKPSPSEQGQRSANFETLALMVRSYIKAYELKRFRPKKPAALPNQPPTVLKKPETDTPNMPSWSWLFRLNAKHRFQGFNTFGVPIVELATGWSNHDWSWILSLGASWPQEQRDAYSTLRLFVYEAKTGPEWIVRKGNTWDFTLGMSVGLDRYSAQLSDTQALLPNKNADEIWSLRTGLGAAWTWFSGEERSGLGLRIGLDTETVWGAPIYKYQDFDVLRVRNKLWFFQPQISFGLVYREKNESF